MAKKSSHAETPAASVTEQAENNEIKQLPQTEQQQTLSKLRSALETKIQSEINQLNRVLAMQDGGKGPNHFDYELVKVVKDSDDEKKEEPKEAKEVKDTEEKSEAKEEVKTKSEEPKEEKKEEEKADDKDQIKQEVEARVKEKLTKKSPPQAAAQLKS